MRIVDYFEQDISDIQIIAYEKLGENNEGEKEIDRWTLSVPDESIIYERENIIKSIPTINGDNAANSVFSSVGDGVFNFTVVLQNIFGDAQKKDFDCETIIKELKALELMYGYSHESPYVKVFTKNSNSDLSGFTGKLIRSKVLERRFDNNHVTIEAMLDLSFTEVISSSYSEKKIGRSSPDLTHKIQFTSAHSLSTIAKDNYGSCEYLVHVAENNNLNSIRPKKYGSYITLSPFSS